MFALTEKEIRASFVNATRREVTTATLPDLAELQWDRLDYLGWRDRKAPLSAYVIAPLPEGPTGIILRANEQAKVRRRTMCAWCEDVVETGDVTLYVARRGGAEGRKGNTIGTLICTDFRCSKNVRRLPTSMEAGTKDEDVRRSIMETRREGLIERSRGFVAEILRTH
ncbi:FBP domain-containing protein [Millisia brevis]|uniref:FBP domain-containing protein n=1 Tax=Millisia brevis TaxID=264148 RepID=UPI00083784AB